MSSPPKVLRIKRKRTEEPLQALLVEKAPSRKKSRVSLKSDYVFTLARTEKSVVGRNVLNAHSESTETKKIFSLPKKEAKSVQEEEVDPQLLQMVDEYLEKDQKRRKLSGTESSDSDYVYDVYYRDTQKPVGGNIGYVRFTDEELQELEEGEEDTESAALTDDEDSNSENYYQNDYPEDEDADFDANSLDRSLDESIDQEFSKMSLGRGATDELYNKLNVEDEGVTTGRSGYDGDGSSFLDTGDDTGDDTENFSRHQFFAGDKDDPIAIHRDKIFGRLQKMIDKRNN